MRKLVSIGFPDTGYLEYIPQPIQLKLIKERADSDRNSIQFYYMEEFRTLATQEVLMKRISAQDKLIYICFLSIRQFCYGEKLNLKNLNYLLYKKFKICFVLEDLCLHMSDVDLNTKIDFLILTSYSKFQNNPLTLTSKI